MTREEAKSCIGTIEMLQRLAYDIHGVMDVIDADNCKNIIKALEQQPCEDCCNGNQIEKAKLCQKSYIAGMEHKQKTGWIPVSERLPEESKRYVVATKYNDVMTDFYTGERFLQGDDIIAWMSLPEPYKAESEDKHETDRKG